jgi:hypothetical protein
MYQDAKVRLGTLAIIFSSFLILISGISMLQMEISKNQAINESLLLEIEGNAQDFTEYITINRTGSYRVLISMKGGSPPQGTNISVFLGTLLISEQYCYNNPYPEDNSPKYAWCTKIIEFELNETLETITVVGNNREAYLYFIKIYYNYPVQLESNVYFLRFYLNLAVCIGGAILLTIGLILRMK